MIAHVRYLSELYQWMLDNGWITMYVLEDEITSKMFYWGAKDPLYNQVAYSSLVRGDLGKVVHTGNPRYVGSNPTATA